MRIHELTNRQQIIYLAIRNNFHISQNKLKEIVVPKHMAGKTFEKELKYLTENNFVSFERIQNRKHFFTPRPIPNHESHVLTILDTRLKILENSISEIEQKFSQYSIIRKNTTIIHLLTNLQNLDTMINLSFLLFDKNAIKDKKETFEKLVNRAFTLARSMKRNSIFSLFHFVVPQEMLSSQNLERFVGEEDFFFDPKSYFKTS